MEQTSSAVVRSAYILSVADQIVTRCPTFPKPQLDVVYWTSETHKNATLLNNRRSQIGLPSAYLFIHLDQECHLR